MSPTSVRVLFVTAAALATGTLLFHFLQVSGVSVDSDGGYVALHWQPDGGDAPGGPAVCWRMQGFVFPAAMGAYGLADGGAGRGRYVGARVCVVDDGGVQPPPLPDGLAAADVSTVTEEFDGGPRVRADIRGGLVLRCACSTGSGCSALLADAGWGDAPTGNTLPEGAWDGGGCRPKPCLELAGWTSWPDECPQ